MPRGTTQKVPHVQRDVSMYRWENQWLPRGPIGRHHVAPPKGTMTLCGKKIEKKYIFKEPTNIAVIPRNWGNIPSTAKFIHLLTFLPYLVEHAKIDCHIWQRAPKPTAIFGDARQNQLPNRVKSTGFELGTFANLCPKFSQSSNMLMNSFMR
jgi:hypothetical protein